MTTARASGATMSERATIHGAMESAGQCCLLTFRALRAPILNGKNIRDLKNFLRDPANYFISSEDSYRAERTIGFHLAWFLIEEIGGGIVPSRENGELKMVVKIPGGHPDA